MLIPLGFISIGFVIPYKGLPPTNIHNYSAHPIPPLIFRTYDKTEITQKFIERIKKTHETNSDVTEIYITDRRTFIATHCPDALWAYNRLIPKTFQSDLFHYCALYAFGGWALDLGIQITKSLYSVIPPNTNLFLPKDPGSSGYTAGFIGASPKHEFMFLVINQLKKNVANCFYGKRDLEVTGPELLGNVFRKHRFNNVFISNVTRKQDNLMHFGTPEYATDKFIGQQTEFYKIGYKVRYGTLWEKRKIYKHCH